MKKITIKYRQIYDGLNFGYDGSYTIPGRDGNPSVASVLTKFFSVKANGDNWSETVLLIADIQAEISRVYDKGSAFDVTRLAILERYKAPEEEEGTDEEKAKAQVERERLSNEEFQKLLDKEVELEFKPLERTHLNTLPAFNGNEIRAIRWMLS